ncbi:MAG: PEP-CTERM sorting domain-containing protein, partial [Gammaproteobacteria bacterium]|nr:PEP-CTERM sorting domain-containing protein [Gammaproteobacteria bacterium]
AGVIGDAGLTVTNRGAIIANAHDPLAFTDAGFTNSSSGLVQATHGATLHIFSATFSNQGTLRVDAGSTIDFDGNYKLANYNSATNTLTGGTYFVGGTLQFNNAANGIVAIKTNAANLTLNGAASQVLDALNGNVIAGLATNAVGGSFTISNGRDFTSADAFLTSGTLTVGGASTFNAGAGGSGAYTQSGASSVTTILQGGALHAATLNFNGGALNVFGTLDPLSLHVCGACELAGTGTVVANVSSDGNVAPGTATGPGTLSINGAYTQGTAGKLVIDLAGVGPGQYSVLNVRGGAALGGTVDFVATGGFHPASGADFTFLLFGSESGSFQNVLFTNWSCPSGDKCAEVLGSHSLSLDITGKGGGGGGVPEPPTWLLCLTGLIWFIARRRQLF